MLRNGPQKLSSHLDKNRINVLFMTNIYSDIYLTTLYEEENPDYYFVCLYALNVHTIRTFQGWVEIN